jgi:hypothetical protein
MQTERHIVRGEPESVAGVEVTPLLQVRETTIGPQRCRFGVSRVVPGAVEVRDGTKPVRVVKIPDPARWVRVAGIVVAIALILSRRRRHG